jgi:hypothetical protein
MDVTGATRQLDTPDGKMEAYEARPKDSGSYPGIVVLMEALVSMSTSKKLPNELRKKATSPSRRISIIENLSASFPTVICRKRSAS